MSIEKCAEICVKTMCCFIYGRIKLCQHLGLATLMGERTKHRKLKDIEGSKNIENDHIENFYIENDHIEKNDIMNFMT